MTDTLTLLYEADKPFPHRIWKSDEGYIQIDYMNWKDGDTFPACVEIHFEVWWREKP